MDPIILVTLAGALLAVSVGGAKLVTWVIDRREEAAHRAMREAALIAQATAHAENLRWYDANRFAYARDDDGFLDLALLAPCDEADFYGWDDKAEVPRA